MVEPLTTTSQNVMKTVNFHPKEKNTKKFREFTEPPMSIQTSLEMLGSARFWELCKIKINCLPNVKKKKKSAATNQQWACIQASLFTCVNKQEYVTTNGSQFSVSELHWSTVSCLAGGWGSSQDRGYIPDMEMMRLWERREQAKLLVSAKLTLWLCVILQSKLLYLPGTGSWILYLGASFSSLPPFLPCSLFIFHKYLFLYLLCARQCSRYQL